MKANHIKHGSLGIVACVALLCASVARAGVEFVYGSAPSAALVGPGQTAVDIFLQEVLTDGSSSFLASRGVSDAAFALTLVSGDGATLADLIYGDGFVNGALNSKNVSPTAGDLVESIGFSDDPVAIDGQGRVLFGTAVFDLGSGSATTWQINLYNNNSGNVVAGDGTPLDAAPGDGAFTPLVGGATFNVVPEPAGVAVMSLVMLGLGLRRRR